MVSPMEIRRSAMRWLLAATSLTALTGCGPSDPKLHPTVGTVRYEGKPAAGFVVEFSSQAAETKGMSGSAEVAADGSFMLRTRLRGKSRDGVVAGSHRVVVIPPPAAVAPGTKVLPVPIRYADYLTSELTAEVATSGTTSVTLELKR